MLLVIATRSGFFMLLAGYFFPDSHQHITTLFRFVSLSFVPAFNLAGRSAVVSGTSNRKLLVTATFSPFFSRFFRYLFDDPPRRKSKIKGDRWRRRLLSSSKIRIPIGLDCQRRTEVARALLLVFKRPLPPCHVLSFPLSVSLSHAGSRVSLERIFPQYGRELP